MITELFAISYRVIENRVIVVPVLTSTDKSELVYG